MKVGFQTAAACFLISAGFDFLAGEPVTGPWLDQNVFMRSARAAGWCLVAGYLVAGSLPFIEQAFGVVTNISLLEMSDISHPLLRELVRLAPGTYNHSIAVATIGETAAERIGANGLLVRVGAYYHDVGKMLKPHYFIENVTEGSESRHLHLAPAMSTLIIIGHVKDGVDLAMQYNLPAASDRLHRAASRHDAGRILLSRGDAAGRPPARLQGERRGIVVPLSGSQAANARGRRADAGRRGRERQPLASAIRLPSGSRTSSTTSR